MNTEETKEKLNFKAYNDVIEHKDPSFPDNIYYMTCYHFWKSIQKD